MGLRIVMTASAIAALSFMMISTGPVLAAEKGTAGERQHREAGAHVHGHGKANIAISGKKLLIEFEVPADDIVGFEKRAKTAKQKAAIEEAHKLFGDPPKIVELPAAADCRLVKSNSDYEVEGKHAEFHVMYEFDCKKIADLQTLDFGYFKQFPRAKELEVAFIGPSGQKSFEVVPAKPQISLAGLV